MDERRRTRSTGFWITVIVLVVFVVYPLSYGPAWRLRMELYQRYPRIDRYSRPIIDTAYQPLTFSLERSPPAIRDLYSAYHRPWRPILSEE